MHFEVKGMKSETVDSMTFDNLDNNTARELEAKYKKLGYNTAIIRRTSGYSSFRLIISKHVK